jgi:hypothetical protein
MRNRFGVTVEGITDGLDDWNDWTPPANRVLARRARVVGKACRVTLTEIERHDPSLVHVYAWLSKSGGRFDDTELDATISVRDLDELIDALTLARDTALANWMMEPATVG